MQDKLNANKLNKDIRSSLLDTKRKDVRKKIIPGNSKTLWDAAKIAMDKENIEIPDTVHYGQETYRGEDIPEAFAQYFKAKVNDITESTTIDDTVFNGTEQIQVHNEFFMDEIKIREIISTLKIKNCEGIDRIPL